MTPALPEEMGARRREKGDPQAAAAPEGRRVPRKKKLGRLQALEGRLPDGAVVWDLDAGAGPAAALFSKRHRYRGLVPDRDALARARRRAPRATFVEGTWETAEIERGTAEAVLAPGKRGSSSADIGDLVERAAGWLKPGGYLLLTAKPCDVAACAPHRWLDAASEREPRRATPTAGVLHEAGLEIVDYELSPAKKETRRTLWLIAARPAPAPDLAADLRQRASAPARSFALARRAQPLTVFVHIPKAAGTTFTRILQNNYPADTVGHIGNLFKGGGGHDPAVVARIKEAEERTAWMHVLTGHIPLGVRHFLPPDTRYVTFLREPVDRILSHYYVLITLKRRPDSRLPQLDRSTPLRDVLADGRLIYDNLQTRMLSGDIEPLAEVSEETLQRAKQSLRSSDLVFGLTERYEESVVLIGRTLGLRNLVYRDRRVNPARSRSVTEEMAAAAREFDRYDLALYRYARELFAEIVAEQDEDFAVEVQALREARAALGTPAVESRAEAAP